MISQTSLGIVPFHEIGKVVFIQAESENNKEGGWITWEQTVEDVSLFFVLLLLPGCIGLGLDLKQKPVEPDITKGNGLTTMNNYLVVSPVEVELHPQQFYLNTTTNKWEQLPRSLS